MAHPRRGQRLGNVVTQLVWCDDCDAAGWKFLREQPNLVNHASQDVIDSNDSGTDIADPNGLGSPQTRGRRRHHLVGQLHNLSRDAIADRQPDHPRLLAVWQILEHVDPITWR